MSGDLQAGRELDALIAEKVMGWKRPTREFEPWCCEPERFPGLVLVSRFALPRFSDNIGAAWEALEVLRQRGFKISVHNRASNPWACWICSDMGQPFERTIFETADTAPLAICLAALEAVAPDPSETPALNPAAVSPGLVEKEGET